MNMNNKLEVMVYVGRLEVRFANDQQVMADLAELSEKICSGNIYEASKKLGHLLERIGENEELLNKIKQFFTGDAINTSEKDDDDIVISEEVLNTTLEDLDFSVRTFNCLKRYGISTVRDMVKMVKTVKISTIDFMTIRNMNKNSYTEIMTKLKELGINVDTEKAV